MGVCKQDLLLSEKCFYFILFFFSLGFLLGLEGVLHVILVYESQDLSQADTKIINVTS